MCAFAMPGDRLRLFSQCSCMRAANPSRSPLSSITRLSWPSSFVRWRFSSISGSWLLDRLSWSARIADAERASPV